MLRINFCCVCFRNLLALWDRFRAAERTPTCFVVFRAGLGQVAAPPRMETDFLMKKPEAGDVS